MSTVVLGIDMFNDVTPAELGSHMRGTVSEVGI